MAIKFGNVAVTEIYYGNHKIKEVWQGSNLIYTAYTVAAFNEAWTADNYESPITINGKSHNLAWGDTAFASFADAYSAVPEGTGEIVAYGGTVTNTFYNGSKVTFIDATVTPTWIYGGKQGADVESDICLIFEGCTVQSVIGGCYGGEAANVSILVKDSVMTNINPGGATASSPINGNTLLDVSGSTIQTVYGGGYSSEITGNITVNTKNTPIKGNIYGGRLLNSANASGSIGGKIVVDVSGGSLVGQIIGGDRSSGANTAATIQGGIVMNVDNLTTSNALFIGGYAFNSTAKGIVNNGISLTLGDGNSFTGQGINGIYAGGFASKSGELEVTGGATVDITGGTYYAVYGGGWSQSLGSTHINGDVIINVTGGSVQNLYGGGNNGTGSTTDSGVTYASTITGDIVINIDGGTVDTLHAAGKYAASMVTGNATVNIKKPSTFTLLTGYAKNPAPAVTGSTTLNIEADLTVGTLSGFDEVNVEDGVSLTAGTVGCFYGQTVQYNHTWDMAATALKLDVSGFDTVGTWHVLQALDLDNFKNGSVTLTDVAELYYDGAADAGSYTEESGTFVLWYDGGGGIFLDRKTDAPAADESGTFALIPETPGCDDGEFEITEEPSLSSESDI